MADLQGFLLQGNARRRGIAASLTIHAGLLLLLFSIPTVHMIPAARTIYMSFGQEGSVSPERLAGIKPEVHSKTTDARRTVRQESIEKSQSRPPIETQAALKEKPAAAETQHVSVVISPQAGHAVSTKKAATGASNERPGPLVQTVFGTPGAPSFIHREIPVYPLLARRLGKEGKVVLKLGIDEKGNLQHIEVVEPSGFGFTEAALEAVRKSSFAPAHRMGSRIASKALLSVRFVLK